MEANRRHLIKLAAAGAAGVAGSSLLAPLPASAAGSTSAASGRGLVDLSHPVQNGLETFPTYPRPIISHYVSYEDSRSSIAEGRQYSSDLITLLGGSSTYMDAPRHFFPDGGDIASIPLTKLVDLPTVVIPAPADGRREYVPGDFRNIRVRGCAVLLATGWDAKWATPDYAHGNPYLGPDAAHYLVDAGVGLVGIDAILVDDIDDPNPRPIREAHFSLLSKGIPIIENMTGLRSLPRSGVRLTAVPAAVTGVGNFPVRAFAR